VQSPKGEANRADVGLGVGLGVGATDGVAPAGLPVALDVGGLLGTVAAVGFGRYPARVKTVAAATMKTPAAMLTPVSRGRRDHGSQPLLGCIWHCNASESQGFRLIETMALPRLRRRAPPRPRREF
jgi:hypothetical protein